MYGMATPSSDWDWRGVCVRPAKEYLSYATFEQSENFNGEIGLGVPPFSDLSNDTVIYDLKKYLSLANKGNPNILELLFSTDYAWLTDAGIKLVKNRHHFLTRKCKNTYVGYAHSQIKRMENHRKWLLNPPTAAPEPKDYGFSDNYPLMNIGDVLAFCEFLYDSVRHKVEYLQPTEDFHDLLFERIDYKALFKTYEFETKHFDKISNLTGVDENFIVKVQNSKRYYNDLKHWDNYNRWKTSRNPERAKNEAKCGYDTKHATHCLRLQYQALGILENNHLYVSIDDFPGDGATFLRKVKAGKVSYEEVSAKSRELFELIYRSDFSVLRHPLGPHDLTELFIELVETHAKDKTRRRLNIAD